MKIVYRSKPFEEDKPDSDVALQFATSAAREFFALAGIEFDEKNYLDVVFERGVAEDYLAHAAKERKKIAQMGPITRATLARFDSQGKAPFKAVTEELKKTKRTLGNKPAKSKPRCMNLEAFAAVAEVLQGMSDNDTLPEGAAELASELLIIARNHEDSHEALKDMDTQIKEFMKAFKAGSNVTRD